MAWGPATCSPSCTAGKESPAWMKRRPGKPSMSDGAQDCIFCKIARGEIPSKKIYDDAEVMAFHDIRPAAPVHFLIIPKAHIPTLYEADMTHAPALGKLLALAGRLAREAGAADGFRTIIN